MMFGQYVIMGTWAVTLSTFIMSPPTQGGLNFPAADTAWVYSTLALAAIFAPVFTGLLADRLFAAERLMGVLHLLGAMLLLAAGWWCLQQQPRIDAAYRSLAANELVDGVPALEMERCLGDLPEWSKAETQLQVREALQRVSESPKIGELIRETFLPLFLIMLFYSFCNVTCITLSNVIAFRNLKNPHDSFGGIRLFGTVGWIVAGVHLELFWNVVSPTQLFLSAGFSLVFGLLSFGLPSTPPTGKSKTFGVEIGLNALSIFRDNSIKVLVGCTLGIAIIQQFYTVYFNRFLRDIGAPYPAAIQTVAQVFEAIFMMLSPLAVRRFGLKAALGVGLSAWAIRNSIFATQSLPAVILVGLPLHGLSYAFFIMLGSMYVDRKAPSRMRASAQGIYTFVSMGVGPLIGNWLSAQVIERQIIGDVIDWSGFWIVPAGVSAAILLVYVLFFRESTESGLISEADGRR